MNCDQWQKQILLKQSGELTAHQIARLNRHIESCADCRKFEQQLGLVHRTVTSNDEECVISEFTRQRILQEAARQQKDDNSGHTFSRRRHAYLYLPALAALLLAVLGLSLLTDRHTASTTEIVQGTASVDTGTIWEDSWDDELNELQESVLLMNQSFETATTDSETTTYTTDDLARELLAMEES